MFDNISGKLKGLAKFTCWLGIITSVIWGIVLMAQTQYVYHTEEHPYVTEGIIVLIFGVLGSWIGSWALYALGEIADNSDKAVKQNEKIISMLEKETNVKSVYSLAGEEKSVSIESDSSDNGNVTTAIDVNIKTGNYVKLGTYPQTASGTDMTPIEWLVLERVGRRALLISKYGLDVQPYSSDANDVTWEKSSLRKWLNDTFISKAFTAAEQKKIELTSVDNSKGQCFNIWETDGGINTKDSIFLLSYAEAKRYFGVRMDDSRNVKSRVEPTAYAVEQGAYTSAAYKVANGKASGIWWLRSPGSTQNRVACVHADGSLTNNYVNGAIVSVRPAVWVNL